jgi:hypothetical protein
MAWIKSATARREAEWVQVDDSLTGAWGRSALVFLRDGLIAGLLFGVLIGVCSDWPEAKWQSHRSGWSDRMKDVSDQIGTGPAPSVIKPKQVLPAPVVTPPQQQVQGVQARTDGTDMESANSYMPKWDMGFSASTHTLTFRLACMPARTPCADTPEEPAYVVFEGPASARLTATVPMKPTADSTSYSASLFVVGPDQFSAPNRVVLPVGQWRMTVSFPKFAKQSEKKFWVSCPRGEACSAVDYPIPLIER